MFFSRVLIILLCAGLVSFDFNADIAANDYIEKYKELAVVEMYRTGIPASITLAQGLHESNYGTSKLALEANNHFGIKCKSYWTGKTYYYKDDDYNKNGQLTESCFRAYNSDLDSYIDRSNFCFRQTGTQCCSNLIRQTIHPGHMALSSVDTQQMRVMHKNLSRKFKSLIFRYMILLKIRFVS